MGAFVILFRHQILRRFGCAGRFVMAVNDVGTSELVLFGPFFLH